MAFCKWYFTFGSDDGGGWSEVSADSEDRARAIFELYHPQRNYCSQYSAEEFEKTTMYCNGNLGQRDVEHIILSHFDFTEVHRGART